MAINSETSAINSEAARLSDSFAMNDALEEGLRAAEREIGFLERFGADDQEAMEEAIKKLEALSTSNAANTTDDFTRALYDARISEVSARTYLAAENIKDAERAAEIAKNFYAQYPDDLRAESAALYNGFSNAYLEAAKEHIDTAPEKAEQLFAKALDYSNLQYAVDEGPLDTNARYVAQSEVGFSSHQAIGTDNIRECIVLALRDSTGRVALAHIDYSTDANSLDAILKHLNTDGPIKAKVVGGDTASPEGLRNIDIADTFLQANNIDVVAANVGGGHVSAIVVDPQTFEIKNAVPMQGRAESALQNGLAASVAGDSTQYKDTEKPIRIGYDDAIGQAHESVNIRPHQVASISEDMLEKSPLQTYIAMEEQGQMSRGLMLFDQIYAVHDGYANQSVDAVVPSPRLREGAVIEVHVQFLIDLRRHIASRQDTPEGYIQMPHSDAPLIGDGRNPAMLDASYIHFERPFISISIPDFIEVPAFDKYSYENGEMVLNDYHDGLSQKNLVESFNVLLEDQGLIGTTNYPGDGTKIAHDRVSSTLYVEVVIDNPADYERGRNIIDQLVRGTDTNATEFLNTINAMPRRVPLDPVEKIGGLLWEEKIDNNGNVVKFIREENLNYEQKWQLNETMRQQGIESELVRYPAENRLLGDIKPAEITISKDASVVTDLQGRYEQSTNVKPKAGLTENFNQSVGNEVPPAPDNVQSINKKIDTLEAAADMGKSSAKGARLLKAGVVTTVAATAAGVALTEYAHNQQQELAQAYHEAGLLSDEALADYNEMNENVKNIVITETTLNQLPILGVAIGMAATEATARSHFNDWLEKHGPLDDKLYQSLKMDMLGGSSLKAQFAMAGAEMIPRDLSEFPPELHSLWEAKQRMDNAQDAIPGSIRTRDGSIRAQRAEAIAEKTDIYEQEKAAYQGEFDRLLSDPSTAAQMLEMMPQDLLLEMVDQTAMARANNTHDPTIQRIAQIKEQLDDGLGGRKNATQRAALGRELNDLKEDLEQNPEKMHGYIRDVFGGHKAGAPTPNAPKVDTAAPSQFEQYDEQTQDRLIDELAQDAKSSDELKNAHPYIRELAELTAGIEQLERNREGKSARQLSKMGRNAQNLTEARERLETVKDEIKANPSVMDRALHSQSPLSTHPFDNAAGDKGLIQDAQNIGIDIKAPTAVIASMGAENTFQAPQL
jgi:hypothetical protein